jgi:hypothetical protein
MFEVPEPLNGLLLLREEVEWNIGVEEPRVERPNPIRDKENGIGLKDL